MNIVLLGASLQSGNRGVNALTRAQIVLLIKKYKKDINIIILSYTVRNTIVNNVIVDDKEYKIKEVPCTNKQILKSYLNSKVFIKDYIIDIIDKADFILDISEGDSFSDIYGEKRFFQHSVLKLISINRKKKLILMPQTLGPFKNKINRIIASKILNKSYKVYVRDNLSKSVVDKELNIKRSIQYSPDMAFCMEPDRKVSLGQFLKCNSQIVIGFNISALLYNGGYNHKNMFNLKVEYKQLVNDILKELLSMNNVKVILIPHVLIKEMEVEDDFSVCKKIAYDIKQTTGKEIYTLDKYYREDELKSIISECDFFIGSRMHACIAAISSMVPTVALAYSRKFIGIWNELSLSKCVIDLTNIESKDEVINGVKFNLSNSSLIKSELEEKIPVIKEKVRSIFDDIEEKDNG